MKILVLAALFFLQEPAITGVQGGVVTGQVMLSTGAPAAGVRIAALAAAPPGTADSGVVILDRVTQTDEAGRYRLENVPPGRYYITAGLVEQPTYYPGVAAQTEARTVMVGPGLIVEGIHFALARSAGVRVTGRVSGLPPGAPSGAVRVRLQPARPGAGTVLGEAFVSSDGAFEFLRILPGTYTLRNNLYPVGPANISVEVNDRDVVTPDLDMGLALLGRIEVEGGSALPVSPISALPVVQVRARNVDGTSVFLPRAQNGGVSVWFFTPGEYQVGATVLPFGYNVKSIPYGDVDLLRDTLKIPKDAPPSSREIRIVLTTDTLPGAPAGMKVSGRVNGWAGGDGSVQWASLQTSTQGALWMELQRVGEAPIQADGTFEFVRVPAGAYAARAISLSTGPGASIAVNVGDSNVTGVELDPGSLRLTPGGASPPPPPGSLLSVLSSAATIPHPTEAPGVKVAGRVVPASGSSANDPLRPRAIILFGPRDGLSVESAINEDGSFEFPKVAAGTYDARTRPLATPTSATRIVVGDGDLTGLQVAVPAQAGIRGRIVIEDGSALPAAMTVSFKSAAGEVSVATGTDGAFAANLTQGEYRVSVSSIPSAYRLKSLSRGSLDLTRELLRVVAADAEEIRVTLDSTQ